MHKHTAYVYTVCVCMGIPTLVGFLLAVVSSSGAEVQQLAARSPHTVTINNRFLDT